MPNVEIKFYGELEKYNPNIKLNINSIAQGISLIESNYPEFRKDLLEKISNGLNYEIVVEYEDNFEVRLSEEYLDFPLDNCTVNIYPTYEAKGTFGRIIGGLALLGLGLSGVGFLGLSATSTALVGGTLALSGFQGIFNTPENDVSEDNDQESFIFSGATNVETSNVRVPLVFGAGYKGEGLIVGSVTIAGYVRSYDVVDSD